ncbi:MAG: carbohydrate-binding protein [Isosphaeraceae bacterium]
MKSTALSFLAVAACSTALQAAEFHVAQSGNDANPGSFTAPLRTIQRGAEMAQPGDTITVHQGVYRERVHPPRGGTSDRQRIVYRAAPGEHVEIKGSDVVKGWVRVQGDVWKVTLPNSYFGKFNPYSDLIHGDWFDRKGRDHHTGAVYLNGDWLTEATSLEEVMLPPGHAPEWLNHASREYLFNVAWMRVGQGSGPAARIPATAFTWKHGTQSASCSEGGDCIGFISHGDWVCYEGVDLGRHAEELEIRVASAANGGVIELRLDGPEGELLGACPVSNTGGWQTWVTCKARLKPASGVRTLCLKFKGNLRAGMNPRLWFGQVDKDATTIWAQFPGVNPNDQLVEINARRSVFYPDKTGVDYLTVSGFTMRHAATPWAPPTAEQIGLIGTRWSKGWIIENNTISHSVCSGISLGKYGDQWDNTSANTAEGYVKTIERALAHGWNKETIGHHLVRNNTISHCEQAGIVGSLGAAFSVVTGNDIHDIHVRQLFSGAEMAGVKFHGAIDVQIIRNHIHHTCRGLWLDWMAQGTRVSRNLFHDNQSEDLFVEVDHGPFLVDNNVFLSPRSLLSVSQGGAYVHNLLAGALTMNTFDARLTPYLKAHSTEVAGLADNPRGDDRYYNNLFVERGDLSHYDTARLSVWMRGNVFIHGARPSKHESLPFTDAQFNPGLKLSEQADGFYLTLRSDKAWAASRVRQIVTTKLLGQAVIPGLPYESPDGLPIRIDTDYFGNARSSMNPLPGPFEKPGSDWMRWKVW